MGFCRNSIQNDSTADGSTITRPPSGNDLQQQFEIEVIDRTPGDDLNKPPSYEEFIASYATTNNAGTAMALRNGLPAPPNYASVVNGVTKENHYHM